MWLTQVAVWYRRDIHWELLVLLNALSCAGSWEEKPLNARFRTLNSLFNIMWDLGEQLLLDYIDWASQKQESNQTWALLRHQVEDRRFPEATARSSQLQVWRERTLEKYPWFHKMSFTDGFLVSPLMKVFEQAMQEDTENLIERVRGIYGFKVTNGPNGTIY